jgi:hypothetical protein
MTKLEQMIQAVSFPRKGEFFSMVCIGWKDNSYKESIFECIASDASRVVAKRVHGGWPDSPQVFYRADWQFDDVSELLEALGIGNASVVAEQDKAA